MKWQYLYICAIKLRACMYGMVCIKSWVSEWSVRFSLWIMKKVVLKVCVKSSWILDWHVCMKMNFRLKNMCELWGRKLLNNKQKNQSKDKFSKFLYWAIYASVTGFEMPRGSWLFLHSVAVHTDFRVFWYLILPIHFWRWFQMVDDYFTKLVLFVALFKDLNLSCYSCGIVQYPDLLPEKFKDFFTCTMHT